MGKVIKAYSVVFESKKHGIRYLCTTHAKDVKNWAKEAGVKFFSMIHSDVYGKKCHLCRKRR